MPTESFIELPAEPVATGTPAAGASQPGPQAGGRVAPREHAAAPLVALSQALAQGQVVYCRWTGHRGPEGERAGEDEVELLVSRAHMRRVAELFCRLGFRLAKAPPEKAVPGALDAYAYDPDTERLIRVHARHQLLLGDELTRNYRLPIERQCLDSAAPDGVFRMPAPEYEFIVFALRALLRHSALEILCGRGETLHAAQRLSDLEARTDQGRVRAILNRELPYVGAEAFEGCLEALRAGASTWRRLKARLQVLSRLQAHARRPLAMEIWLRLWRRAASGCRRHIFRRSSKYRLESGGAIIAIAGGDGAGKSTVVDALYAWLSRDFATASVHLGKPSWSWTTATIRAILKLGQLLGLYPAESNFRATLEQESLVSAGYPWLLREFCRARDRYASYVGARRFAAAGGLLISDRFPLPQIQLMDGPLAQRFLDQRLDRPRDEAFLSPHPGHWLARALVRLEASYYQQIASPEVLIVLRVDPEIAVARRRGEDEIPVRERSTEIWQIDWQHTNAHIIDASKSKSEVLAEVKALVWSEL